MCYIRDKWLMIGWTVNNNVRQNERLAEFHGNSNILCFCMNVWKKRMISVRYAIGDWDEKSEFGRMRVAYVFVNEYNLGRLVRSISFRVGAKPSSSIAIILNNILHEHLSLWAPFMIQNEIGTVKIWCYFGLDIHVEKREVPGPKLIRWPWNES